MVNNKITNDTNLLIKYNCSTAIGVDEVGRGCLAGPVVACALYFKPNAFNKNNAIWLNKIADSKTINKKNRADLANLIRQNSFYKIACIFNNEIDKINILQASLLAMHNACCMLINSNTLNIQKTLCIIDGNKNFTYLQHKMFAYNLTNINVVKADNTHITVAAASILAKTYRDNLMNAIHNIYSNYNFNSNYGYPTKQHYLAIKKYGLTCYHRLSFNLYN